MACQKVSKWDLMKVIEKWLDCSKVCELDSMKEA